VKKSRGGQSSRHAPCFRPGRLQLRPAWLWFSSVNRDVSLFPALTGNARLNESSLMRWAPQQVGRSRSPPDKRTTQLLGCPRQKSMCCLISIGLELGRGTGGGSLLKDLHRLTHLCDPEDQERRIGVGFGSTVAVVDVDTRVAEPRCGTRQLSGTMSEFDLRNFRRLSLTARFATASRFG